MKQPNPHFSPDWDDASVLLPETLYMPLILPPERPLNKGGTIWVAKKKIRTEEWRGKEVVLEHPHTMTMVMRKSEKGRGLDLKAANQAGEPVGEGMSEAFYDLMFPPRVWMCNSLTEMSMMLIAAKEARGKVLVGGLGLGIYPQMVMLSKRPVSSITIVETNPDMIRLVERCVQKSAKKNRARVKIVEDTIENYMATTERRFDTIYLDTWGDLHFKFLAYINHLISMASKIATPTGRIQCWGYNFMYQQFIKLAVHLEDHPDFDLNEADVDSNTCLQAYLEWRKSQSSPPSPQTVEDTAARIAVETIDPTPIPLYVDEARSPTLNRRMR